jgi:hypothetical protein
LKSRILAPALAKPRHQIILKRNAFAREENMGQLIAGATADGVMAATHSRAVWFEPQGEERLITINRLIPVTPPNPPA